MSAFKGEEVLPCRLVPFQDAHRREFLHRPERDARNAGQPCRLSPRNGPVQRYQRAENTNLRPRAEEMVHRIKEHGVRPRQADPVYDTWHNYMTRAWSATRP